MLCMEETDFSWKQSLTASLTEQQLSFASEEFILHQVLQCHCQAQQGHCWSSNAVNSDLIRVGLRPPSPFAQVTDQHSFIYQEWSLRWKSHPVTSQASHLQLPRELILLPLCGLTLNQRTFLNPSCLTCALIVNFTREICSAVFFLFRPYLRPLRRGQTLRASPVLEKILLQWQCCCWQFSSPGMVLPFMPGITPRLWPVSSVCVFSLLIFLTRHWYLVSISSAVNNKAISTIPTLLWVQCLADVSDQKRTFGDFCLNFLLGWERDKRTGLVWTALIWFPKREIPFHFMHPYRPKQCSCAMELTLEDTEEHPAWDCPWLYFPTAASPPDTTLRSRLVLARKGSELSVSKT